MAFRQGRRRIDRSLPVLRIGLPADELSGQIVAVHDHPGRPSVGQFLRDVGEALHMRPEQDGGAKLGRFDGIVAAMGDQRSADEGDGGGRQ